jgi:hypothetical protein
MGAFSLQQNSPTNYSTLSVLLCLFVIAQRMAYQQESVFRARPSYVFSLIPLSKSMSKSSTINATKGPPLSTFLLLTVAG